MLRIVIVVLWCICVLPQAVRAQVRGVYPLGMSATNSGVTPQPGFSYANLLAIYSRDKFVGPEGEILATGQQSVVMDLNDLTMHVTDGRPCEASFEGLTVH